MLQIFIFCIKTSKKSFITVLLFPSTHISSKLLLKKLKTEVMEQLDNLIYDTIRHIKKQQETAQRECTLLNIIQIKVAQ